MNAEGPGFAPVAAAAGALDSADLEYWCFGGWAVDLWAGQQTRHHDDVDLLVWRHDEERIDQALTARGWEHAPTPEDLVGTNYEREGVVLQLTFAVAGPDGAMVVPMPDEPFVVSEGPLAFAVRDQDGVAVRVLPLSMMLATKSTPRPDEAGGGKDRADLAVLREVAELDS